MAVFCVVGYWTGPFIGSLVSVDRDGSRHFEIVDPLRPVPAEICPFPRCGLGIDHDGDHAEAELPMRRGQRVTIPNLRCVHVLCVDYSDSGWRESEPLAVTRCECRTIGARRG
jgi:hypothetical protein